MVNGLLCIVSAVSARRMRLPLYSPFCRCAIMKCAMSSAGEDIEPAGAGPTISKFVRLVRAQLVALGHQRREFRRQRLTEGRVLHIERNENMLVEVVVERLAR